MATFRQQKICMAATIAVILLLNMGTPGFANPTCILNCAQCVQLYGDFFDGHSCAKLCIESRGRFDSYIDCADPTSIAKFIKT